jgi:hypothetical protein
VATAHQNANSPVGDQAVGLELEVEKNCPLSGRAGHLTALFGAALAGVGAPLAVIHLVLAALGSAGLANVGANAAQFLSKL